MTNGSQGRLLHVLSTTQRRGAEVFATELAPALDGAGWRSALVALAPADREGLDVEALGSRRLGIRTLRELRRRIRDADVVIAHGSTTLPACVLAGAATRVPLVYRSVGDPRYWAPTRAKRLRTAALMGRADRVVALTDEAAEALRDHYRLRESRIVVIPKGVSSQRLRERTPTASVGARRALGLPDEGAIALCLGALSAEKNVAMALEAAAQVHGLLLAVAGTGPELEQLQRLAGEVAPGRVRFLGDLRDPATALAAADVLVIPSHTEGMPGVAMEAGMAGIPVVATDVGWVRDIVIDGCTGVLVPRGDAGALARGIETALADAPRMGRAGRAHCLESFDIDRIADRWSTMLQAIT